MHVHSENYLARLKLFERVFYAVGDVRRHAHLCLHPHVGGGSHLGHLLQQALSCFLIFRHVEVVVNNVESHYASVQFRVAHQYGHIHQILGIFGVFHRDENLLVVVLLVLVGHVLVAQDYSLSRLLGDDSGYDAGEEYHYDNTVQHVVVYEFHARRCLQSHSHQQYRYGTGGMSRRKTEHHVTRRQRQLAQETRHVSGYCLAEGAEEHYRCHHGEYLSALEQHPHVDEHSHSDEEIGYEDGVAYELDAVHKWRQVGYVTVQNESRKECTEDAVKSHGIGDRGTHEEHRHDEDELHHGIAVTPQEPACKAGDDDGEHGAHQHYLQHKPCPEYYAAAAVVGRYHRRHHHDGKKQRNHR